MSSSVFSESPVSTNESRMSDSNLVVVYGKNGVNNVDREGLENLIDDKEISTISVVRLTSPTPSMKEEEKAENDLKKYKKNDNEDNENNKENSDNESEISSKHSGSESGDSEVKTNKDQSKNNTQKEKPETVGLLIEDFCLPEKTKEITKAALALSGLQPLTVSVDFEIQVKALKNDHCYTPLTSPSQLHDRKPETKSLTPSAISAATIAKAAQKMAAIKAKNAANRAAAASEKIIEDENLPKKSVDESEDNETAEDENESEFSETEESADTDNDRDSDLDFDVNDRTGRRRKSNKRVSKRKLKNKILKKRQSVNSDFNSSQEEDKKQKLLRTGQDKSSTIQTVSQSTTVPLNTSIYKTTPVKYNPVQSPAKVIVASQKSDIRPPNRLQSSSIVSQTIIKTQNAQQSLQADLLSNIITGTGKSSGDPSGKPVVQNVVIIKPPNKNSSGGFTDITKYLTKSDNLKTSNVQVCELIKPDNSGAIILRRHEQEKKSPQSINTPSAISSPIRTPRKGFMPLVPDKTKAQQLPAQISVQIQQKSDSNEIQKDYENQDEMDIIDSLMGQIQNAEQSKIITTPKIRKTFEEVNANNQNMFENQSVIQKKPILIHSNASHSTFTTATNQVDPVDISNAPLLETPDEIPEDLIKDIAELVDHKTFQELVEEQQQQQLKNQRLEQPLNVTDFETSIPKNFLLQPIQQSEVQRESQTTSILIKSQEGLDNNHISSANLNQSEFDPPELLNEKSNSNILKETQPTPNQQPVQIVSRSGRVITLPPIEAPTTRAKRRAAAGVVSVDTPTPPMSSNVSEASESEFSITSKVINQNPKQQQKGSNSRRTSKDQQKKSGSDSIKKQKRNSTTTQSTIDENVDSNDDSSQGEDDDDPNKLWCICRQPHNNRFMICCDSCEDWFHGTCVGVTKSMGKEMELNKTEWTCPNCKDGKKQQTIKHMFEKQSSENVNTTKIVKNINQVKIEKGKSSVKKNKRKSADVLFMPSVSTPLSKSMQQQISEIIGVPLPESITQSTEDDKEQSEITLAQNKKVIVNKVIKTPIIPKVAVEKTPLCNKKKESQPIKEIEPESNKSNNQYEKELQEKPPEAEAIFCIVCKKEQARPNSIYCSDDCIRKHAHNALICKATKSQFTITGTSLPSIGPDGVEKKKKQPSSFEEALANASIPTPKKIERVYVFERKTGKIITGNNAPTTANLKRWLQENPTFEVVQPGSPQAVTIERNKFKQKVQATNTTPEQQRSIQSYRQQSVRSQSQQKNVIKIIKSISSNPSPKSDNQAQEINEVIHIPVAQKALPFQHMSPLKAEKSEIKVENKSESVENKIEKYDKHKALEKNDKIEKNKLERSPSKTPLKKQISREKERDKDLDKDRSQSSEPIRLNVKRTLKEKLITRLAETSEENHPRLSENECEKFANETEEEMFELFKDTGVKYKAKYRSLAFNIKDHKNKTLFKKICDKVIEPKQLVRMTPEELASQELAQWRENENKHQLEMIKKSELDLLSCAKNYVLKTHKGEEVIEDKHTDRVNLDITIPVEDVVAVLNNSTVSSTSEIEKTTPNKEHFKSTSQIQDNDADSSLGNNVMKSEIIFSELNQSVSEIDEERKKKNEKEKDRERDKRYRNKERHREKSSKRSRSRSRERKRHKTPPKDEENHSHHHKSYGKFGSSQSPEDNSPELTLKKDYSEDFSEPDRVHRFATSHEQDEELRGFDGHEHKYKYSTVKDDEKKMEDKREKDENVHNFESNREVEKSIDCEHGTKSEKREGKSHHHHHYHHHHPHHYREDEKSTHHDHKRRSYTHSPSIEDEDEKKKRRNQSSHHIQNNHHRSSSLVSGSSPSIDSEESRKDTTLKTKIDSKSSTPTSTTVSDISGSTKKVIITTSNKQNTSNKVHKSKPVIQKSVSKDISEYSLIDKIFAESEKTIEEAANLVPVVTGKEKSLVKPADSQSSLIKSSLENTDTLKETKDSKKIDNSGNDSEQELPSSTVTIPTPPEDPYKYYASDLTTVIWTGNINMIDVATFNIIIQPISGNHTNIEKEFPNELDVVGRIGPETVWDYIGKIKKSPNKEIVLVRLIPSPETETNAYTALYLYLEKRKRLGVVKSTSPGIKDFYVLPLNAKTTLPPILRTASNLEFFDDDSRPDLLIGILIRIMDYGNSKRYITANPAPILSSDAVTKIVKKSMTTSLSSSSTLRGETSVIQNKILGLGDSTDLGEDEDYKPESPHMNIAGTKVFNISTGKTIDKMSEMKSLKISQHSSDTEIYAGDDADEPYSPGGSSDDDINSLSMKAKISTSNISNTAAIPVSTDEIQRKVEEINRQIEKEKKEIENLGSVTLPANTAELAPALANISIPSNLQQILASIQKPDLTINLNTLDKNSDSLTNQKSVVIALDEEDEYNPEDAFLDIKASGIQSNIFKVAIAAAQKVSSAGSSRLASLSEAELLKMVPDNIDLTDSNSNNNSRISDHQNSPPPLKKTRWDIDPPPPGLEDEYE